jgi:hypothetical protein
LIGRPRTWLFHQIAADLLRDVAARCEAAAIPLLPVKGVVTAHLLYGDVADRPLTDVDIRIRPRDFLRFRRLGRASGWRCVRVARTYHNLIYDFPGLSLDVEGHVGPPGLCALTVEAMLSRAVATDLAGLRLPVPEVHDHAVLLVVNVFKDKLGAAASHAIADVERIVEHPSFDRATFLERVIESRIATITWLVAGWMESQRGSSRWGGIRALLEQRRSIRRLYGRLFHSLLPGASVKAMALRLLARVGADNPMMQGKALLGAFAWELEMALRSRLPAPSD